MSDRSGLDTRVEHNLHILRLIRDDPGWALSRILFAERLERERAALLAEKERLEEAADKLVKAARFRAERGYPISQLDRGGLEAWDAATEEPDA